MQLKANRLSDPIEVTAGELMQLPLDAAFYVYKTGSGYPAHNESSETIDCTNESAADRVIFNVSCDVIDYLGGAAPRTQSSHLHDVRCFTHRSMALA